MRTCTTCNTPSTHLTTYDGLTGVNIIKPGERLCDKCHAERTGKKVVKVLKQLSLF